MRHQDVNALKIGALKKPVGRFRKNVGVFPKNVGDFSKNVGDFFSKRRRFSADPHGERFRCSFVAHSMFGKRCLESEEKATSTAQVRCSLLAESDSAFRHSVYTLPQQKYYFLTKQANIPDYFTFRRRKEDKIEVR